MQLTSGTIIQPSNQQQQQQSNATGGTTTKTTMIGGNVVKLVPSGAGSLSSALSGGVAGGKILMKNSNLMQVGKMTTNAAGKPAFVITNKQGQQIRPAQQIIFVTTAGGQAIRTVQVSVGGMRFVGRRSGS